MEARGSLDLSRPLNLAPGLVEIFREIRQRLIEQDI